MQKKIKITYLLITLFKNKYWYLNTEYKFNLRNWL